VAKSGRMHITWKPMTVRKGGRVGFSVRGEFKATGQSAVEQTDAGQKSFTHKQLGESWSYGPEDGKF